MEFKVEIPFELVKRELVKMPMAGKPMEESPPEHEKNATRFLWGVRSRRKPEAFVLLVENILLNEILEQLQAKRPDKDVAELIWKEASRAAAIDLIHYAGIGTRGEAVQP